MHHLENVGQINETFVNNTKHINIAMSMYNLVEYSDNNCEYSEVYGNLKEMK